MHKPAEVYPVTDSHRMLARAITSKRGGTTLYTDDGSDYFPDTVCVGGIGRNLTFYTAIDASDTLVDMGVQS